ncbi:putative nucleoporin autopeptidase [Rosellinia necatrix]|uniref:Putative nucleoporin autopeptidase n=1 Tax=Rosellinia necatrix TaxID=77044 RepID=A0A1W2TG79_ROSNE|nr:putative nucleoporin autopeptidase [Rosellinia necatrix]
MSFGGFGGGGAFGGNNAAGSTSGFGGFGGTNANTGSAFGSANTGNTTSAFGSPANAGGGLFGSGGASGFNSNATGGGGFGATSNTGAFGTKPGGFGTTTSAGGGLFGGSATTTTAAGGFGGFGSTTNNASTSSPFGGGSGSTLFGSNNNKSAFGSAAPATSGGLFGGSGTNTGTTSAFGAFGNAGNNATANALGAVGDPPGTANVTNFQPVLEKENATSNAQNSFQNILFQDAYKKWSADEVRLVDYGSGRRYGGASGSNTFGVGSGFGSFGTSNQPATSAFGTTNTNTAGGGLFGNNASQGGAFGAQTNTGTNAFGANTGGGGLFGAKPATTGGMFGSATATSQPAQPGGLFATSGTNAFGANANTGTSAFGSTANNTAGGLFANNNQNKAGFSFGTNNTNTSGFGGATNAFGTANTNTGGGAFGTAGNTNTSGGLFGNANQQATSAFGTPSGFGAQNQQQQQAGGLFGGQQKPAGTGLFGATNTNTGTTGGLFGNNTNTSSGFGGQLNTAPQTGGGLFGSKPATGSTGGLFGNAGATQNTNTGGGLFGSIGQNNQNQQQQSQQSSGLFGSVNQNQQKPSLFGTTPQPAGNSFFGSQNNQQQGSMFGSSIQQQPQNSTMGGSLFGNSQGAQSNAPSLTASINDPSAFGTLFTHFGGSETVNPGPLATPSTRKQSRRPSILPYYKLNPASASRFVTPQKRGYGFSYSTYGTPNSPGSVSSTPGAASQGLLGGSLSRSLGKSVSASNLRRSFNVEDSVLVPGAFSTNPGSKMYQNGSVKKLVINKDLRSDLFSTPTKDKSAPDTPNAARSKLAKRVSFDTTNVDAIEDGSAANGSPSSTPSAEQLGYVRPKVINGISASKPTATPSVPEMEQVKGNELAIVHEHEPTSPPIRIAGAPRDGEPGEYWMSPTKDEIQNMNRVQRQKVADLTVGRENIGYVKFKVPVDLTSIDIDTICDGIVVLTPRSATVYPNPVKKPPVGKGLNVPALINLQNAWPRASRTGKTTSITKHVERLKKIPDTTFEKYEPETGEWAFSVEHFTTYGLDDSDDEEENGPPETSMQPAPLVNLSRDESPSGMTKQPLPPGAFEPKEYDYDSDGTEVTELNTVRSSFLANGSAGSTLHTLVPLRQAAMDDEYALSEVNDDASDHLGHHPAAEHEGSLDGSQPDLAYETPAGIMRARMRAIKSSATPLKVQVAAGDDWMDMLSKTISPQKRDRALLKSIHEVDNHYSGRDSVREMSPTKKRIVPDSKGFATSIDLMNSLFEKAKVPKENLQASIRPKGIKWPYKRVTKHLDENDMDGRERAWHNTTRPTWGPGGTLIFSATQTPSTFGRSGRITEKNGLMTVMKGGIVSETQDIRIAKFANEMSAKAISAHSKLTQIHLVDDIPTVELKPKLSLKDFSVRSGSKNSAEEHERLVWELASVLFDNVKVPVELQTDPEAIEKLRRENLSKLWESMVEDRTNKAVAMAHTHEEKALAALSGHRVADACKYLLEGKNYRLATLVALIGTDDSLKKDIRDQLREWQGANVLSEFSQPIRALYEMLSGNVCACEGTKGALENRANPFLISERFGLNWQQAFGLRLWYAISTNGSIAEAFKKHKEDVEQDKELGPAVWFAQHGVSAIWDDPRKEEREDILWGLLKLYSDGQADLEAVIRPENSQLSPLDYRLCWQLGQALASTGRLSFGRDATEKADAATISFATQLTNEGSWLEAVFVLLHLTSANARTVAIQDHLCRHAALIGNEDSGAFKKLTVEFIIPTQWIWHAKALYMRSVKKDATAEVQCLLRAESWAEAHQAFVKEVAPKAIIERNHDGLANVLRQFEGRHLHVPDWNVGGQIYKAFLQLKSHHRRSEEPPQELVESLLEGLPAMHGNTPEAGIVEYAALTEMAAEVAQMIAGVGKAGKLLDDRILSLPLTEDAVLKHSKGLAWTHYNTMMARV